MLSSFFRFLEHSIVLRPIVGAVVSIPKLTTLQNAYWAVQAYRDILGDFAVVSHRDVCPEESLIRRRNFLTPETAKPPRARIYQKLGVPSPILLRIRPRQNSFGFGSTCCGAPMPQ